MDHYIKIGINNLHALEKDLLPEKLVLINYYAFLDEGDSLTAYIKEVDFNESKLKNTLPANSDYSIEKIAEENWNAKWESGFSPIKVNDFVAVRASFHAAESNVEYDLIITPKMSFGTGHHATTYMMLAAMQQINFSNKNVIDFGAGTGVLAILAAKMGAANVLAIDNDKWSIENIHENIEVNNCQKIMVMHEEAISPGSHANIILANITLNVLSQSSEVIYNSLDKEGFLLISGILVTDMSAISKVFVKERYETVTVRQREKWACILYRRN